MTCETAERRDHPLGVTTLVDLLGQRARHQPTDLAYTFLADGENEQGRLTYSDLDIRARAIGAWLVSLGAAGERVLLLYPSGLECISALFGCLYAGAVAVTAYPIDTSRAERTVSRLQALVRQSHPFVALTTVDALEAVQPLIPSHEVLRNVRWRSTASVEDGMAADYVRPDVRGDTLAVLQYTSGSTSEPKGVMLTHDNILENERMMVTISGYSVESVSVSWLPLAHDYGLFGFVMSSLYLGSHNVFMPPEAFLQKPVRWLRAVTHYQAVRTGGPNFAYELSATRIRPDERAGLDLRTWSSATCGSEPVRQDTLERFVEVFGPCGFRPGIFRPGYGLAEATLYVSVSESTSPTVLHLDAEGLKQNQVVVLEAADSTSISVVTCGKPCPEQELIIVDPDTFTKCESQRVGEVWIAGRNVAQGYWNLPEETAETFQAYTADNREGPFLRTGDLGFLHNQELFLTGRLKDLIIIQGRNHYPQDIEFVMERCHKSLRRGCGAAFSIDKSGSEQLVLVQEVRDPENGSWNEIIDTIRQRVGQAHEVSALVVILVRPRSLPKTSSGKIRRNACREGYLAGKLAVVESSVITKEPGTRVRFVSARTDTEKKLLEIWTDLLGVRRIGAYDHFLDLGGDSTLASECRFRMNEVFGVELPQTILFEDRANIREIAQAIEGALASSQREPTK